MANTKIKAYFLRVDEKSGESYRGYFGEIENTLEAKQRYVNFDKVGGYIQCASIGEIIVICHEEGKRLRYPPNRVWIGEDEEILDILVGNIMCVRCKGDRFTDIRESDRELIEKHLKPLLLVLKGAVLSVEETALPEWKGDR